ncbi:MAG: hypothetical protein QOC77_3711 [Thermoleophilaceae bacterium]|jgi:hypothetical protein|nr:hypothetical protein [Thermoleophilaceae bacterium]MEA2469779.1 hypothetical protein [Thermoleophilaceae bacterium]
MRLRPRLGDVLLGAFALLLVLAVLNRAEHVKSPTHKVVHVHVSVRHRRA